MSDPSSPPFHPSPYMSPPPPPPPPKPASHETSRIHTPSGPPLPPPPVTAQQQSPPPPHHPLSQPAPEPPTQHEPWPQEPPQTTDPGPTWLPALLEHKSKPDLAHLLSAPPLLTALATSPSTTPPSHASRTTAPLASALAANATLATRLISLHGTLERARADASTHLATHHSLTTHWRAKQRAMDAALARFAPQALYARLGAAVGEQEALARALEESFLEGERAGDGEGKAGEREVAEWVRRYREGRRVYYLRREGKERWDEGRVGGWR
ncbi:MAG: hypothetical protein M1832_001067 [Thelocarpon impressellum]|nr:MAG: hypothetical protein M1832_001067 [Thelocarpon impressellum]